MKKLNQTFKKYWFFFGILLIVLTLAGIDSWTKYVTQKQEDGIVKAVEMFFASDVLKEEPSSSSTTPDYTIVDWKNNSKITFELHNYPDSQRFTSREIEYKLTSDAAGGGTFTIIDPTTGTPNVSGMGELPRSTSPSDQKAHKVEFTLNDINAFFGEGTEKIVNITATTTAPYDGYQLSAKFLIRKADVEAYRISILDEIDSPHVKVTIDANTVQNLTLTWDNNAVVPDQTNSVFKTRIDDAENGVFGGNGKTIDLNSIADGGSVTFLMLKYNSTVYNADTYTDAFTLSPGP